MMKKYIATFPLVLLLTACGGGGGDGQLILAPSQPDTGGDTASGGDGNTDGTVDGGVGGTVDGSGGADTDGGADGGLVDEQAAPEPYVAEASASSELTSDDHFDFSTRWDMNIDFDIEAATGTTGFLSICTEFEFDGEDAYGVNFDKCALRTSIVDGIYNGSMAVTNDISSVLAVIWFADESGAPVYNEFELVNGQESIQWR